MASSSTSAVQSQRQWYLVLRRAGHATQTIRIPIRLIRDGQDLDQYIGPAEVNPDFEFIDDASVLPAADRANVVTYEFLCVTQSFEATEVE